MSLRAVPAPAADAPAAIVLPEAATAGIDRPDGADPDPAPAPATPDRYRYTVRRRLAEREAEHAAVVDEGTGVA